MTHKSKTILTWVAILVGFGLVTFSALRVPRMWGTSVEDSTEGKLISRYACGQRIELQFFMNQDDHPYRVFVQKRIPWVQCIGRFLAAKQVEDAMTGSVSVYVDFEADGLWDRRLDFDGSVNDSVSITGVQFDYFERESTNAWEAVAPADRYKTFSQMVYDPIRTRSDTSDVF